MKALHERRLDRNRRGGKGRGVFDAGWCTACVAAAVSSVPAAWAAPDAEDPLDIYFNDEYSYEDNLFRVPDSSQLGSVGAAVKSLDDYVNRMSVGLQARMDAARQVFALNLRFDDVRYAENDSLNYRGGSGDLAWDFSLGSNWSGSVKARYDRKLASFSNYRFFARDVVETAGYNGEVRYAIGSRWAVLGSGSVAETGHSAPSRQVNKFKGETLRGGIEYRTPSNNVIAFDYRDTAARFPIADSTPGGLPFRYDEQQPGVTMFYAFTAITQLRARAAYIERDYMDPRLGDFSGPTWNLALHWAPSIKLYFDVKGWHELTAYADAESDYYVGEGISITPTWEPTSKVTITGAVGYEQQDYEGNNTLLIPNLAGREDEVATAELNIEFEPRDYFSFGFGYRWIERESNRDLRGYDNSIVSAQIKVTL